VEELRGRQWDVTDEEQESLRWHPAVCANTVDG
jgi:hypothetical protein